MASSVQIISGLFEFMISLILSGDATSKGNAFPHGKGTDSRTYGLRVSAFRSAGFVLIPQFAYIATSSLSGCDYKQYCILQVNTFLCPQGPQASALGLMIKQPRAPVDLWTKVLMFF